jgi:hypothetical protein
MTRNDVEGGSVVDLFDQYRPRTRALAEVDREPDVVDAAEGARADPAADAAVPGAPAVAGC